MKILKKGRPRYRYDWLGAWRCLACQSVIALDETDEKRSKTYEHNRAGEWLWFECPICGVGRHFTRAHEWVAEPPSSSKDATSFTD